MKLIDLRLSSSAVARGEAAAAPLAPRTPIRTGQTSLLILMSTSPPPYDNPSEQDIRQSVTPLPLDSTRCNSRSGFFGTTRPSRRKDTLTASPRLSVLSGDGEPQATGLYDPWAPNFAEREQYAFMRRSLRDPKVTIGALLRLDMAQKRSEDLCTDARPDVTSASAAIQPGA